MTCFFCQRRPASNEVSLKLEWAKTTQVIERTVFGTPILGFVARKTTVIPRCSACAKEHNAGEIVWGLVFLGAAFLGIMIGSLTAIIAHGVDAWMAGAGFGFIIGSFIGLLFLFPVRTIYVNSSCVRKGIKPYSAFKKYTEVENLVKDGWGSDWVPRVGISTSDRGQ